MTKDKITVKPWGWELVWANTEAYVGKVIFISAGHRLSKQYHKDKEETVYVVEGTMVNIDSEGRQSSYPAGSSFHVAPGQIHRFCAEKENSVKLIEVSTNHLDDVIRLEDDYGR